MSAETEPNEQAVDLHPLILQRIANRQSLRDAGQDPYGSGEPGLMSLAAAAARYDEAADEDQKTNGKNEGFVDKRPVVTVAGRVMLSRDNGKLIWLNLRDDSGDLQVAVSKRDCDEAGFAAAKLLDNADIVITTGPLTKTKTGEVTVWAGTLRMASKSLVPPPEKWAGLQDVESRYRKRYVDLWANPEAMRVFQLRSKIVAGIRRLMDARGFIEVETPMLQAQAGGAAARPFVTHMNALDIDLSMRIAPELYLKRLVVGGFEKVFEVNRNFRNEGLSPRHNPEFTMMEFYEAYANYQSLMNFTEGLIRHAAREALGTEVFQYQGRELDLSKPFHRLTIVEAIRKYHPGFTVEQLADAEWLKAKINAFGESVKPGGLGSLQLQLFEACAEAELWEPTYIIDYPVEVSPLARASDSDPEVTERFELFIVGREIANGFSELNDPEDQAARFRAQAEAKEAGDDEAMFYDADYIRALEFGLPPTGGCGIGIDRLVMLLTDSPAIRDVILFPQMRPE